MMQRWGAAVGYAIPVVFFGAVLLLGGMLDGYSHISQTVSEIGRAGSPLMLPWQIADAVVSILFIAFGGFVAARAGEVELSRWPGYLLAYFGVVSLGMGFFPAPHALHNVFGLALILGYLSPLVAAFAWSDREARHLRLAATVSAIAVMVTMALNLSPLFAPDLYPLEYYGAVQRSLFASFYGIWCVILARYDWSAIRHSKFTLHIR